MVADCMRRIGANYHYSVRQVKKNEEFIVRERIANALIEDPSRSFWAEVKKNVIVSQVTALLLTGVLMRHPLLSSLRPNITVCTTASCLMRMRCSILLVILMGR